MLIPIGLFLVYRSVRHAGARPQCATEDWVLEHNRDVIKTADWIVDLGPEGGDRRGTVVASGTPEQVVKQKASFTGAHLRKVLV